MILIEGIEITFKTALSLLIEHKSERIHIQLTMESSILNMIPGNG
jgi:hypothetical protein